MSEKKQNKKKTKTKNNNNKKQKNKNKKKKTKKKNKKKKHTAGLESVLYVLWLKCTFLLFSSFTILTEEINF